VSAIIPYNDQLAPDAILVVLMLGIEVYLLTQIVPRNRATPTLTRMIIGSTALVGSAGVLMALTGAFLAPTLGAYSLVLMMLNFMMLGPPGIWMISVILFEDRKIDPGSWRWPAAIAGMATWGELMMGLFFAVAGAGQVAPADVVLATLTSAWYLWSMVGAMVALSFWLPLGGRRRIPLLGLAAGGFVAPWIVASPTIGAGLTAGTMGATFLLIFGSRASRSDDPRFWAVVLGVGAAFLAMTLSGALVAIAPTNYVALLAFGIVTTVVMIGELVYLVREGLHPASGEPHAAALPAPGATPAG
jgi:hypothetical protein